MKEYLIIDGNNMAHRCHNANLDLKNDRGNPSGMFYGFVRTLMSLKKRFRHLTFVVVWDGHAKHKYDLKPDYKAGRSRLSSDIWAQVDDIKRYLEASGIDQYQQQDNEADDVIATLCEKFRDESDLIYVYSNDKDLLQLVEDGKIIVFKPKVSLSPEKFYDEEAVAERFGVRPKLLCQFRCMDNDESDGLKGVERVSRKKLAGLINQYKSVDSLYKSIDDIKFTEKERKRLDEAKERVAINLKLIILNRGVEAIKHQKAGFDEGIIEGLLKDYSVNSIKAPDIISLFSSTLEKRFTDPQPAYQLESYSLFD